MPVRDFAEKIITHDLDLLIALAGISKQVGDALNYKQLTTKFPIGSVVANSILYSRAHN